MVRSEQWWRRLLADQQQSGRTVRECCQVAGVHVSSFYRWQKLLAAVKSSGYERRQRKSVLTPVDDDDHADPSSGFVPVKIRQNGLRAVAAERSAAEDFVVGCGGLRVELPNGVVIHCYRTTGLRRIRSTYLSNASRKPAGSPIANAMTASAVAPAIH